jgi:hypothetical protein
MVYIFSHQNVKFGTLLEEFGTENVWYMSRPVVIFGAILAHVFALVAALVCFSNFGLLCLKNLATLVSPRLSTIWPDSLKRGN